MANKSNILKRMWVSKGGAVVMFFLYIATLLMLFLFNISFYDLPKILGYLVVPGALFVSITPGVGTYIGVPTSILFISLVVHMTVGYLFDWFYKPMK